MNGTIELGEEEVKEIIREHLENKGYEINEESNVLEPISIDITKGIKGGRMGYQPPKLNKIKVKVKMDK